MDQQWKHLSDRVEQAETAWGSVVTSLPEQLQIPQPPGSLPKSSISSALAKLVGLVKALGERDDVDPVLYAVHISGLRNALDALPTSIANVRSGPTQAWNVVSNIWGARSALV